MARSWHNEINNDREAHWKAHGNVMLFWISCRTNVYNGYQLVYSFSKDNGLAESLMQTPLVRCCRQGTKLDSSYFHRTDWKSFLHHSNKTTSGKTLWPAAGNFTCFIGVVSRMLITAHLVQHQFSPTRRCSSLPFHYCSWNTGTYCGITAERHCANHWQENWSVPQGAAIEDESSNSAHKWICRIVSTQTISAK